MVCGEVTEIGAAVIVYYSSGRTKWWPKSELPEGIDELVSIASLEIPPEAINELLGGIDQLP
jgi:hypothetical protein